ncbi:hypothetical protein GQ44DRAFT_699072 [Phaeosphaeriaceae sp. PMI808]|nr:hypothetical protein GQ44DRAFT_699072 [Phaeosphaeriaceae sp. PMI808]
MAYSQIRDDSLTEFNNDEKEANESWVSRDDSHSTFYKSVSAVAFVLWITTTAAFVWAISRKVAIHGHHAAYPLPFSIAPSRIITFNPDSRFHYTARDAGKSAWLSLVPNDGGIVSIDQPQKYLLPGSYKNRNDSNAEVYSMSMWHQLHCLDSIRIRLGKLEGFIEAETEPHHGKRNAAVHESHVDHCFDYLRQAIMCAGDLSLEHSVRLNEPGFDGWGTAHQCAAWDAMWDAAMERRYDTNADREAFFSTPSS